MQNKRAKSWYYNYLCLRTNYSKDLLDYPKYGCINVHPSLLPKLRGGAPVHRALINGFTKTGVTIMYMDVEMDAGDIISQRSLDI